MVSFAGRRLLPQQWVDSILAVALLGIGESQVWAGWSDGGIGAASQGHRLARAGLIVLLTVPLAWRRRRPLTVVTLVCVAIIVQLVSVVPYVPLLVGLLPMALANYTAAAYAPHGRIASLAIVFATEAVIYARIAEERVPGEVLFAVFVLLGTWLVGDVVRQRVLRAQREVGAAHSMVAEREAAAVEALAAERALIARELHDVIAHSVSVMGVQAGAARTLLDCDPDAARTALHRVEDAARSSVGELQRLLSVLRADDGAGQQRTPQPGVAAIPALVEQVRGAGLPVELVLCGLPDLPAGLELAAYRIVQEALTNALRHARARTVVRIRRDEGNLHITVRDQGCEPRPDGATVGGHGVVGMHERAHLYGGTLHTGFHPAGGFVVEAWLPLGPGGTP